MNEESCEGLVHTAELYGSCQLRHQRGGLAITAALLTGACGICEVPPDPINDGRMIQRALQTDTAA